MQRVYTGYNGEEDGEEDGDVRGRQYEPAVADNVDTWGVAFLHGTIDRCKDIPGSVNAFRFGVNPRHIVRGKSSAHIPGLILDPGGHDPVHW